MPKIFTSDKQKIGKLGENIAERFLMKHGFSILETNYTKKWGEIDIVVEKEGKLYFCEVKSKSVSSIQDVTHETNNYRPEDNMHPWKAKRFSRTIQTYLLDRNIPESMEWEVDLIVVFLDINLKKAKVKVVKDIIL
ncbi:MAG: putative endonuclease [Patescibacteria group bacterium]|nr:YraN family protein [Candidatus Paceibacterota bacterium]MDQ5922862.1 putative endonuclease [Patescibacteria group bacterium]